MFRTAVSRVSLGAARRGLSRTSVVSQDLGYNLDLSDEQRVCGEIQFDAQVLENDNIISMFRLLSAN